MTANHSSIRRDARNHLLDFGVPFLLALAPIYYGGERDLSVGVLSLISTSLFAVTAFRVLNRHDTNVRPTSMLRIASFCWSLPIVWCLVQIVPGLPDDQGFQVRKLATDALGFRSTPTLSVNPDASLMAFVKITTVTTTFYIGYFFKNNRIPQFLVASQAIIGTLLSIFGLLTFSLFPQSYFLGEKVAYLDSVTSTFINRNTYATYAGITIICLLALLGSETTIAFDQKNWRRRLSAFSHSFLGVGLWITAALLLNTSALLLTGSRAGIFSIAAGIVFSIIIRFATSDKLSILSTVMIATVLAILTFSFYSDFWIFRLSYLDPNRDMRWSAYRVALEAIRNAWLTGYGLGTFEDVFSVFRDESVGINEVWIRAHNVYLEAALSLGVPLTLVCLLGFTSVLGPLLKANLMKGVNVPAQAALPIFLVIAIHSLFDFSLQSLGVAIPVMLLLGNGMSSAK